MYREKIFFFLISSRNYNDCWLIKRLRYIIDFYGLEYVLVKSWYLGVDTIKKNFKKFFNRMSLTTVEQSFWIRNTPYTSGRKSELN